jgi:hypothetical protein
MRQRFLRGAVLFTFSAALTYAFILNLCHAVYRCGCRSWWNGAAEMCNVHQPGVRHCPWCSYGDWGGLLSLLLILIPQFTLSFWPASLSLPYRCAAVVGMFPIAGIVVALGYGWYAGYWR